ncbi:MAG: branched-chain-amino-acid transaminase [Nitrospirota bacterium]|nr:branched-chain-amino-acid transaminase [Nitrospirota bacterium]
MSAEAVCWINGRVVPAAEAAVPVMDHGLLYGDGVFEGIRFYNRRVFRLVAHLERLAHSATAIRLDLPMPLAEMNRAVEQTVAAFSGADGYLRLVVTRGAGPLGIDPRGCATPGLFIIADHLSMAGAEARQRGARVIVAATRKTPLDGLDPRIKSLNYLTHILARMEANHAGADEAVLLNREGRVAEGAAQNVFTVRGGTLFTPPTVDGALAGVTRDVVLELAAGAGIPAREASLTRYDLYTADECFLTGTGTGLLPVAEVDGRRLRNCPGPVFRELEKRFQECVAAG